jgi:hypothetical protein
MRVTIEHREQTTGVIGNHKECYLDCKVEFSEEERAIIKARDLYDEGFTVRTSTPAPKRTTIYGTNLMRLVGRVAMVAGVILGIAGTNFGFLFFVGLGLEIWGWLRYRAEERRMDSEEQTITVKQLLSNPVFSIHAWSAGYAKIIDEEVREHLVKLKNLIELSAEVRATQTFEL